MTRHIQNLCQEVWDARAAGRLTHDEVLLSQQMYVAVAADIAEAQVKYDPEIDKRVEWLRAVIRQVRAREYMSRCRAEEVLEDLMDWILCGRMRMPCGKDRAAGVS